MNQNYLYFIITNYQFNQLVWGINRHIHMYIKSNSNDNDFIGASLGGMGYNCRSYKKTIPKWIFIRGQFQTGIF